jgi:hypothetical protein
MYKPQGEPKLLSDSEDDIVAYLRYGRHYIEDMAERRAGGVKRIDEYRRDFCELVLFYHRYGRMIQSYIVPIKKSFDGKAIYKKDDQVLTIGSGMSKEMLCLYLKHLIKTGELIAEPSPGMTRESIAEFHIQRELYNNQLQGAQAYLQEIAQAGRHDNWIISERNKLIREVKQAISVKHWAKFIYDCMGKAYIDFEDSKIWDIYSDVIRKIK